jgi:hypothetical protein
LYWRPPKDEKEEQTKQQQQHFSLDQSRILRVHMIGYPHEIKVDFLARFVPILKQASFSKMIGMT